MNPARLLITSLLGLSLSGPGLDLPGPSQLVRRSTRRPPRTMVHKQPCKPKTAEAWRQGEAMNPCRRRA